jgi:hypothetical protein
MLNLRDDSSVEKLPAKGGLGLVVEAHFALKHY